MMRKETVMVDMKTIGIIGGSTDLATAEYYKRINACVRRELGGLHTAEIIINSMDCARSTYFVANELWDDGTKYLNEKAKSLERAGADFVLCVSNTWHRASETWMEGVGIPLLHIAEPTGQAIVELGLRTVALLGTKATMSGTYMADEFSTRFHIKVIVPSETQQEVVDRVIFTELAHSMFTDGSRQKYLGIIDDLVNRGAQGIILGCTEIPLLVSQADRPRVPMFDTLDLHATAASLRALSK